MSPRIRKIAYCAAIPVLLAIPLALTGCNPGPAPEPGADRTNEVLFERQIALTDGRHITCVVYSNYKQGGLSCDWSAK